MTEHAIALPTPRFEPDPMGWPNLRGKRCLVVDVDGRGLAEECLARHAASVESSDVAASGIEASQPSDVVVASGVLAAAKDPVSVFGALRAKTLGVLLSVEPLDPLPSMLLRGRPSLAPREDGGWVANGSGHRRVLMLAGFAVERVSRPIVDARVEIPVPTPGILDRLAGMVITGGGARDGVIHRSILGRPSEP